MKRAAPSRASPAARIGALRATKGREFRSSVVVKEPLDSRGQILIVPAPLAERIAETSSSARGSRQAGWPRKIFEVPGFLWSAFPKAERSPVVIAADLS
jgi:hypothetical protein